MSSGTNRGQGIATVHRVRTVHGFDRIAITVGLVFAGAHALIAQRLPEPFPLARGFLLVLGAIPRDVVLTHPTRIRILSHLQVLPGDHFRSIVRMLGLGVGNARHHLDVLRRNGFVREDKTQGRVRYYVSGAGSDSERNQLFAKHWNYRDLRLRVLFVTKNLGDATPASIAAALGISRQLAAYHLSRLAELGLVRKENRRYRA